MLERGCGASLEDCSSMNEKVPRYTITLSSEEWDKLSDRSQFITLQLNYCGVVLEVIVQREPGD